MTSKIKIIAVEGIDGVGKSTFCNRLLNQLGDYNYNIAVAKTPHKECNELAMMTKAEGILASFCGYLIGDICISNQFKNYEFLILDRYILSTLVYHDKIVKKLSDSIFPILEFANVIKPTMTILLEADISIIEHRLRLRKEPLKPNKSYLNLQRQFEKYTNDPNMLPWLGNVIKLRSENNEDYQNAFEKVSKFLI